MLFSPLASMARNATMRSSIGRRAIAGALGRRIASAALLSRVPCSAMLGASSDRYVDHATRQSKPLSHKRLTEKAYTAMAFLAFAKSAKSAFVSCSLVALAFPSTPSSVLLLIPGRNCSGAAVAASHIFRAA